jgi:hypothetical protein
MGRPVSRIVLLIVSALVTVAAFALAPIYSRSVLAAAFDALSGQPQHQCGGG